MKCLIRLFFILIFFSGCFSEAPQGIIQRDKMISLLTDIHLVDSYTAMYKQDSARQLSANLYYSVFTKYQTDSVQFKKSLQYYSKKPEEFYSIYQKVQENLDSLNSEQTRVIREKGKAKK